MSTIKYHENFLKIERLYNQQKRFLWKSELKFTSGVFALIFYFSILDFEWPTFLNTWSVINAILGFMLLVPFGLFIYMVNKNHKKYLRMESHDEKVMKKIC